jgi:hypothetical protein
MINTWEDVDNGHKLIGAMFYGFRPNREKSSIVRCPFCGCVYVKAGQPEHIETDEYDQWAGRGNLTRIPFECEDGHSFNVCFGFHKGETYTFIEEQ